MKTNKSYKDMTREERREAAQAKAQTALDRLGDGIRSVWDSEAWRRWLTTLAKFHDYSLNNSVLIAMQMPEATRVASYRSWRRDFDRHVDSVRLYADGGRTTFGGASRVLPQSLPA